MCETGDNFFYTHTHRGRDEELTYIEIGVTLPTLVIVALIMSSVSDYMLDCGTMQLALYQYTVAFICSGRFSEVKCSAQETLCGMDGRKTELIYSAVFLAERI